MENEPKNQYQVPSFEKLIELIGHQNEKPQWKNQPVEQLVEYIGYEQQELSEAITEGQDTMHIASEIADVLYLTLRLCQRMNIDPAKALQMKIVRNAMKYPPRGDIGYDEYTRVSKEEWQLITDNDFFDWWRSALGEPLDQQNTEK